MVLRDVLGSCKTVSVAKSGVDFLKYLFFKNVVLSQMRQEMVFPKAPVLRKRFLWQNVRREMIFLGRLFIKTVLSLGVEGRWFFSTCFRFLYNGFIAKCGMNVVFLDVFGSCKTVSVAKCVGKMIFLGISS